MSTKPDDIQALWDELIARPKGEGGVRLQITLRPSGPFVEIQVTPGRSFEPLQPEMLDEHFPPHDVSDTPAAALASAIRGFQIVLPETDYRNVGFFQFLLSNSLLSNLLVNAAGRPVHRESLQWIVAPSGMGNRHQRLRPIRKGLHMLSAPWTIIPGATGYWISNEGVFDLPGLRPGFVTNLLQSGGVPILPRVAKRRAYQQLLTSMKVASVPPASEAIMMVQVRPGEPRSECFELRISLRHRKKHVATYIVGGWHRQRYNSRANPEHMGQFGRFAGLLLDGDELPYRYHSSRNRVDPWGYWRIPMDDEALSRFSDWLEMLPAGTVLEAPAETKRRLRKPRRIEAEFDIVPSNLDWFEIRGRFSDSEGELTKEEVGSLYRSPEGKEAVSQEIVVSDKTRDLLAILGLALPELLDPTGPPLQLHALQLRTAIAADALPPNQAELVRSKLERVEDTPIPDLPASVNATLRPYQLTGFSFLAQMYAAKLGVLLADEMGLGKTIQLLAWLEWIRLQSTKMRVLVVCPRSIVDQWQAEAAEFTPQLRIAPLPAVHLSEVLLRVDVVICTYAELRLHAEALCSAIWDVCILDEATAIKNPDSAVAKAAYRLRPAHRVAVTGTPVENRLRDLWSLMQFVQPDLLGSRKHFKQRLEGDRAFPMERQNLSTRIRPFMLRRLKRHVATDLPPRHEQVVWCELPVNQQELYSRSLRSLRKRARLRPRSGSARQQAYVSLLTGLTRLRQIVCDPRLLGQRQSSGKLARLMRLLKPMMRKRQKVVVFSQFVSMLELIECELRQHGWRCMKLTGSTRRRSAVVEQFQSESGPLVFLISLQAGGAGLNLTAAEHVVLYDPWWNPAVERQAGDRAHRIGQKKAVTIWKMLARNTIEEKVLSLQSYKKALADGTLDPSASLRSLEDVQNLINGSEEPPPWNKKDSSLWKPDNSSSDAEDSEENDDDDSDDDSGEEWKREP